MERGQLDQVAGFVRDASARRAVLRDALRFMPSLQELLEKRGIVIER